MTKPRVAILGAGLIGCYLGGRLLAGGQSVTLIGRQKVSDELAEHGLITSDLNDNTWSVAPGDVPVETGGAALAQAQIVLVTVKCQDTLQAAEQIAASAPVGATVVSLQNGIRNAKTLRSKLPRQNVIVGIVPFNVVRQVPGHFHCATGGSIVVESCGGREEAVVALLRDSKLEVQVSLDIDRLLWGKLLMNLSNSINALAGVPLEKQLSSRGYRVVFAQVVREALSVLRQNRIEPKLPSGVPARLLPLILSLPNWAFLRLASSLLKVDPAARSSMWEDLQRRRLTEIDYLNGEVTRLAATSGLAVPLNRAVIALIKRAELGAQGSPNLTPEQLQKEISAVNPIQDLEQVIREELSRINERRELLSAAGWHYEAVDSSIPELDVYNRALSSNLCGLAISGGGIRSATFGLGIIQGLAANGLLPRFDYLSTVSGGGYIGAWLMKWMRRDGMQGVIDGLEPPRFIEGRAFEAYQSRAIDSPRASRPALPVPAGPADPAPASERGAPRLPQSKWKELLEIGHLRHYSNYLSPKLGVSSIDGWVLIAIFLRNLLLNQLVLLFAVLGVFFFVQLWVEAFAVARQSPSIALLATRASLFTLGLAVAFTVFVATRARFAQSSPSDAAAEPAARPWLVRCWGEDYRSVTKPLAILWLLAAFSSSLLFAADGSGKSLQHPGVAWLFCLGVSAIQMALAIPAFTFKRWWWDAAAIGRGLWSLIGGALSGLVGGLLVWGGVRAMHNIAEAYYCHVPIFLVFGPPFFLICYVLTSFLHMGLARVAYEYHEREWWSALNARLLRMGATWLLLLAIAVLGTWLIALVIYIDRKGVTALVGFLTWVGSTAGGLWAARSSATGTSRNSLRDLIARIAPAVFVFGLLLTVSFLGTGLIYMARAKWAVSQTAASGASTGVPQVDRFGKALENPEQLLRDMNEPTRPFQISVWLPGKGWRRVECNGPTVLSVAVLGCLAAWFVLGSLIGVNTFSLHDMYAARLVRCYLGAINNQRRPDPFTNLDPNDDIRLVDLASAVTDKGGPILILNGALNRKVGEVLPGRERESLAFQDRQAESFVLTPYHCGSESTGFCPTELFANSIQLGGAVSVSGAAVSPNMGYHSSPAVTALLTVFNMRLGAWFANPTPTLLQRLGYKNNPPAWYLLSELFGQTDSKSSFVYISDGGHFENMGVYELIRRRCRFIIAVDSGADPVFLRENLGHLVRKVRIDLGVRIEIDTEDTRPSEGFCQTHVVVGRIHYGDVHRDLPPDSPHNPAFQYPAGQGILVYLKVGLTGDEPADLLNYQAQNPLFPYDPTLDQFYSESQFESYRTVGLHTALKLVEGTTTLNTAGTWPPGCPTRDVFEEIYRSWMRDPPGVEHYLACNETYASLQAKLRSDTRLKYFAVELCGAKEQRSSAATVTRTPDEALAERLMLVEMMTLLENAYLSLRLDRNVRHPYHAGWREVLKNWKNTSVFKGHWEHVEREFSGTFRDFLNRINSL